MNLVVAYFAKENVLTKPTESLYKNKNVLFIKQVKLG